MFSFVKHSPRRWRMIVYIFRPKITLLSLLAFFVQIEPIESAAASFVQQQPRSLNDCVSSSSSILITKTTTCFNRINRATNNKGMSFRYPCNSCHQHGGCSCRRYSWGLGTKKPEKADNDDNDGDDDNKESDSAKSSSSLQQQEEKDSKRSLEEKMNMFLDQEFFNPSRVDEKSPFKWFANLVERDYETAEALYASVIIVLLVIVSQELLRIQIHGFDDHYVPFTRGGGGGGGLW